MIGTGEIKKMGDQLVRGVCLIAAAVSMSRSSFPPEQVIDRAKQFETYVREGS